MRKVSEEFAKRIVTASQRYAMPCVWTNSLVEAIRSVTGFGVVSGPGDFVLELLDVIKEIIPGPSIQDVKIATFLIGHGYEAKDISYICAYAKTCGGTSGCNAVRPSHREALAKLLEDAS